MYLHKQLNHSTTARNALFELYDCLFIYSIHSNVALEPVANGTQAYEWNNIVSWCQINEYPFDKLVATWIWSKFAEILNGKTTFLSDLKHCCEYVLVRFLYLCERIPKHESNFNTSI